MASFLKEAHLTQAIETIDTFAADPTQGLGDELFHLVSKLTPLVNVDLLIKNAKQQILLTWRSDQFYGPGWHIPGGVLRFKETFAQRIKLVAQHELNATVTHENTPCAICPTINRTRDIRGHFVSLLFRCQLITELDHKMMFTPDNPQNDQWMWHSNLPQNFLKEQKEVYMDVFSF